MVQTHIAERREAMQAKNDRLAQEAAQRTTQAKSTAADRRATTTSRKSTTSARPGKKRPRREDGDNDDDEEENTRPAKKVNATPTPSGTKIAKNQTTTTTKRRTTKQSKRAAPAETVKASATSTVKQIAAPTLKKASKKRGRNEFEESEDEDAIIEGPSAKKAKANTKGDAKKTATPAPKGSKRKGNRDAQPTNDVVEEAIANRPIAKPRIVRKKAAVPVPEAAEPVVEESEDEDEAPGATAIAKATAANTADGEGNAASAPERITETAGNVEEPEGEENELGMLQVQQANATVQHANDQDSGSAPERTEDSAAVAAPGVREEEEEEQEDRLDQSLNRTTTKDKANQEERPSSRAGETSLEPNVERNDQAPEDLAENEQSPAERATALLGIFIANALSATELKQHEEARDKVSARISKLERRRDEAIERIEADESLDGDGMLEKLEAINDDYQTRIESQEQRELQCYRACLTLTKLQKTRNKRMYDYVDVDLEDPRLDFSDELPQRFAGLQTMRTTVDNLEQQVRAKQDEATARNVELATKEKDLWDQTDAGRYRRFMAWNRVPPFVADVEKDDFRTLRPERLDRLINLSEQQDFEIAEAELLDDLKTAERELYDAEVAFNAFVDQALTEQRNLRLGPTAGD